MGKLTKQFEGENSLSFIEVVGVQVNRNTIQDRLYCNRLHNVRL